VAYTYVQARYDFGVRKGPTLGLMFHGAEADAGVVGYLSRQPARGVSANFVCERSGRMVQMLPLSHASGSMNPNDRSTNKAYYGHDHLVDVLESWWRDPNSAVISVEIEMFARNGPNPDQVASLIEWSADMATRYPSIQGALGHADQTDTKGCPGSTAAMKSVFAAIGGHGLWTGAGVAIYTRREITGTFTIRAGATVDGYSLSGDAPVIAKTKKWDEASSASFSAILHRTTDASPTPLLECSSGAYEGLYVPTSQVSEAFDPVSAQPIPSLSYAVTTTVGGKVVTGSVTLP
jgi:N-acetyl-anhydromuramyl-L-alanine amidase AmpD